MSRREDRDSDSKRQRSKFDQQPSPKKPRRDGKPATERPSANLDSDLADRSERDQKHRSRLQDASPLEAPPAPEVKAETGVGNKENDRTTNVQHDRSKNSSRPTELSRSRSLNQHDARGSAGQAGRTTGRQDHSDRRSWRDSKDKHSDRVEKVATDEDRDHGHDRSRTRRDDYPVRHHERFSDREANRPPSSRKRPPFTEKKTALDSEKVEKTDKTGAGEEAVDEKLKHPDRPLVGSDRRDDRGGHNLRYSERPERRFEPNRGEVNRGGFQSRDRHGGGGGGGGDGNYRAAKEGFNGRRAYPPPPPGGGGGGGGVQRVEKWKHDLYEEANRSPPRKNEEDQIAKIEALLSS